ncbi:sulfur carrier protein ThiS [bacterium]|nr:sulfur carrier protein ThiS [bacterium]
MLLRVNGENLSIADEATLEDVLAQLSIPATHIAVERNGELVEDEPRACRLENGDRLEIVRFVGGG